MCKEKLLMVFGNKTGEIKLISSFIACFIHFTRLLHYVWHMLNTDEIHEIIFQLRQDRVRVVYYVAFCSSL